MLNRRIFSKSIYFDNDYAPYTDVLDYRSIVTSAVNNILEATAIQ
jgi:hypothetical protein